MISTYNLHFISRNIPIQNKREAAFAGSDLTELTVSFISSLSKLSKAKESGGQEKVQGG